MYRGFLGGLLRRYTARKELSRTGQRKKLTHKGFKWGFHCFCEEIWSWDGPSMMSQIETKVLNITKPTSACCWPWATSGEDTDLQGQNLVSESTAQMCASAWIGAQGGSSVSTIPGQCESQDWTPSSDMFSLLETGKPHFNIFVSPHETIPCFIPW